MKDCKGNKIKPGDIVEIIGVFNRIIGKVVGIENTMFGRRVHVHCPDHHKKDLYYTGNDLIKKEVEDLI